MADIDDQEEMAEELEEETPADNGEGEAEESPETQADESQDGAAGKSESEDVGKTEEELEQELKETQISIPRYAPHSPPHWEVGQMRERWAWHLRVFPIDQEDCRNCILDAATKISQEAWYYVPKRKNGPGCAELCMVSCNEAAAVMARIIRMPFYHQFVTLEITRRSQATEGEGEPFSQIEESAKVVFDSTKCEKIKNTATSKGNQKRRSLWVRYLSENTSKEILRVLFPLSQSTEVETHDNLRIGLVEAHSKTDVLIFMKAYLTVIINDVHILALQNKEPGETENETKAELEKSVTALADLEEAPTEVADRSEQRKDDKAQTSRVLKRTLHQQQRMLDGRRRELLQAKRGRGEPLNKRGPPGGWGIESRFNDRRGGRFGGGGGGGGGGGMYPPPLGGRAGYGGAGDMAAEMMMMQAQLNQTIQNQLMMLNPRGGSGGGGYGGGRFSGGGSGGYGGGGRRGGHGGGHGGGGGSGGGRGGRGGGGRRGYW